MGLDIMSQVMTPAMLAPKACHNCRRQRLKCDRSLPGCSKCAKNGQACLGYQSLFRWEEGVASRGKMAGLTYSDTKARRAGWDSPALRSQSQSVTTLSSPRFLNETPGVALRPLADPVLQDLNDASRKYLLYCERYRPCCLAPH